MLERSEYLHGIGESNLIAHKGDALRAAYPMLDSAVCRGCTRRVFAECQTLLPDGTMRGADAGCSAAPPH